MRWLVVIALTACAGGRPLEAWTIEADGVHAQVELPSNFKNALPFRALDYRVHADVALAPDELDQPLTLAIDGFHGELAAIANGVAVPDIGDAAVGEHRFLLAPARGLAIDLSARLTLMSALGFESAPRLERGHRTQPSAAAAFERDAAWFEIGLAVVVALLAGLSFALDRRRRVDAAVAIGILTSTCAPLWQAGVLGQGLEPWAPAITGVAMSATYLAFLYFMYLDFELGRPPRWLVWILASAGLAHLLDPVAVIVAFWLFVGVGLGALAFFAHGIVVLARLARKPGTHQLDAKILLVILAVTLAVAAPDLLGFALGKSLLGTVHVLPVGVVTFTVAQALTLARRQVARQRRLEHATHELERQVAERSRELADALGKLAATSKPLETDRVIDGRYRVVRKLGAGGMGAVYEVERASDRARFALKTLRGRAEPSTLARFAREAQIAAELKHPNLLDVVDVGIADGMLFLVMPLVTGGSLEGARVRFGDASWAMPLLRQVAAGLAALHARGIVHRDLKPGNVLVADGAARIADFGLASLHTGGDTAASADTALAAAGLTRAGDLFGTPRYMAPELATGTLDAKPPVDVFAFGVLAFETLTGKQPFAAPVLAMLADGRVVTPPDASLVPAVIVRCLAMAPAERPTADEVVALLS